MTTIYRIQDRSGRGPYRPGLSKHWIEIDPVRDSFLPWYEEMGPVHLDAIYGWHVACGCESIDQLRRWFSPSEYTTLCLIGFQCVKMQADGILGRSDTQVVFERKRSLNRGCTRIDLYPQLLRVTA